MPVAGFGGSGIRSSEDIYKKKATGVGGAGGARPGVGGIAGAGVVSGGSAISAAALQAAAAAAGGAGGAGAGGGGGGGGPVSAQVQLSPGVGGAIGKTAAEIAAMKAKGVDPNLQLQIDRLAGRLSTDTTGRAIDRAGSAISDAAAGAKAGRATELARRGVAGGGVGDQVTGQIDQAAARAKAGSAAGISLGRERDLDALTLAGQGIMAAPGQMDFARQGQILGAIGQEGNLAGEQERIAQGWSAAGDAQRRTELAGQQQAQGQYLALLRMLMGGAYA